MLTGGNPKEVFVFKEQNISAAEQVYNRIVVSTRINKF